ncbi:ribonuclease H1 domain-containing protein [Salinibacillus xinjiangensis]|uniref:Ribonuclease H n=1 Tax=Salinibacillus xinjiangensis TaxID=1229268 RepID=A0A6G1X5C8_9BACI|nr:ribonuclease H family protein [Salinibacillus xinjiangensis]MRG86106.1 ribonuclease H [Salinibacillus xinjiangensis]
MAKQKYYVVWSGRKTGIFTSWDECKKQVHGVKGARYKSFTSKQEAEEAFENGSNPTVSKNRPTKSNYIEESISVDAACSGNPGDMEYKGVITKDGQEIFHHGPVPNGTNNIGEFIAIVHALAYLQKKKSNMPIYSDSATALSWVRKKRPNTKLRRDQSTEEVWKLIDRATKWLEQNTYSNKLLKWETHLWGESKADFGRK